MLRATVHTLLYSNAMTIRFFPLPSDQVRLEGSVSLEEFISRLREITTPTQPWFRSLYGKYEFIGEVSGQGFTLTPVIRGQNTYLPRVRGVVSGSPSGLALTLTQALHPLAVILVGLFFAFPILSAARAGSLSGVLIFLAALLIFHLVMFVVGFLPEAKRIRLRFAQLAGASFMPSQAGNV